MFKVVNIIIVLKVFVNDPTLKNWLWKQKWLQTNPGDKKDLPVLVAIWQLILFRRQFS